MALGLLATKPGTALGGRSRSQLPENSVPSNMKSDITPTVNNRTIASQSKKKPVTAAAAADNIDAAKRERSMLSQVDLSHGRSDVSSIPDYDIFSHTETEVKRSLEQKKKWLEEEQRKSSGASRPNELVGWLKATIDPFDGLEVAEEKRKISEASTQNEDPFAGLEAAEDGNKKKKGTGGTKSKSGFGARGAVDPIEAFAAATSAKQGQHNRKDSSASTEIVSNAKTAPAAIKFSSEAANNYYKAMSVSKGSFSGSKTGTAPSTSTSKSKKAPQDDTASFSSDAGKNYYNAKVKSVLEANGINASSVVNSKASSSKKSLKSKLGLGKTKKEKQLESQEKKDLDRLVAEAMAVCQTPEEIAAYLLAKQKGDGFPADANEGSFVQASSKGKTRGVSTTTQTPPAASPGSLPPVKSFEQTDVMSTTSSITHDHELGLKLNKSMKSTTDECSVATELAPQGSPKSEGTDILPRGPSHINSPPHDIVDPPLEAYPSPLCSPDEEELGYPDENGKASVAKELVGLPDGLKLPADNEEEKVIKSSLSKDDKSVVSSKSTKSVSFQEQTEKSPMLAAIQSPVEPSVEQDLEAYSVVAAISKGVDSMKDGGKKDDSNDDDDDSQGSGISHAISVTEALSTTGSASMVALSRGKSNSKKSKGTSNDNLRSVRSMSPMMMLKKKSSTAEENNKKETSRNKLPPTASPPSTTSSPKVKSSGKSSKLRSVRSMSPSLFLKKTPEIPEWDPATDPTSNSLIEKDDGSKTKVSKDASNPVSDASTAASSTTPTGSAGESKIIALAPEDPPAAEDEQPAKSKSMRSASPIVMAKKLIKPIASSSKDTPVTADLKETIGSSMADTNASKQKTSKKQSKKKQAALPPRIPSREVVPPPPSVEQQIMTSSDDDGSVECSVMSAAAGSNNGEKPSNDEIQAIATPGVDRESNNASPVVTTELDNGSVEVSVQDTPTGSANSGSFANKETPKSTNVSVAQFPEKDPPHVSNDAEAADTTAANANEEEEDDVPTTTGATVGEEEKKKTKKKNKKKKSKLDVAKEKYQKKATHQQPKSPEARVAGVPSLDPSADANDDISKATDTKARKKDKLKKIMDYRKKASPLPKKNVDRETLEEWLVSKKSQDSSKGGHTNMLDAFEEELEEGDDQKKIDPTVLAQTSPNPFVQDMQTEKSTIDNGDRMIQVPDDELPSPVEPSMGNSGKPPLAPVVSADSTDGAAPVRQINFDPKNVDDESNADVSLPPELKSAKKIRIWTEDAPSLRGSDTQDVDNSWLCADTNANDGYDGRTEADDTTFIEGKTSETSRDATPRERRRGSIFACGVDPTQLKDDIVFEFKDYVRGVERSAKRSVRNLFGACDITSDGGLEAVSNNMETANDQLFGRKPMSYTVQTPMARQRAEKASNPQTEMLSSILEGTEKEKAPGVTTPEVMSVPGVKPTVSPETKKRLYLEKLKQVSLKHL